MVKDQAVIALIDKKDKPAFLRLITKVRKEVNTAIRKGLPYEGKLISEFWNQCKNKFNDHDSIFEIGNKKIELEDATVTNDLPTNAGLDQCIKLIMATSTAVYKYMEIGIGVGTAAKTDIASVNPSSPRCDMSLIGTREPVGMTIRFLAIFGENYAVTNIRECGVFNTSSGPTMLNHNIFNENKLVKIIGQQAAIVSSIIEFCPKG